LPASRVEAAFFHELKLPDVPGNPRPGGWSRDLVRAVFGSWDPVNRVRMIPDLFALVPKGSSKTTCSAALMAVPMLMNFRPHDRSKRPSCASWTSSDPLIQTLILAANKFCSATLTATTACAIFNRVLRRVRPWRFGVRSRPSWRQRPQRGATERIFFR
jgi:hypothetical protein